MLALLFEVRPFPDQVEAYLDRALQLKPELDRVGGCLFIERFQSLKRDGVLLSFQLWRDEAAMTAWRVNTAHHAVQMDGRMRIFADYRLRIAEVVEATLHGETTWRAAHRNTYNDPAHRAPRHLHVLQSTAPIEDADSLETFRSLYREGQYMHVGDLPSANAGAALAGKVDATHFAHRVCEVERDYGMFERAEAPQFCPVIQRK
ncbi:MAG: antibiotic biosynthesis monooxygenase [Betaproteobacteria bacterium]|nr:antibiotic biosynthesis monooxygenase [Betaproteobacteria bacterium]